MALDVSGVLPANSTLTNGAGTFSATLKTAGNQTITLTDTVTSSITGTSATIAVSAASATHFTVSAPSTATAGTAFNFTVTALDQFNNTATGYAGSVHFTSTDGSAVLPANSTLTNGSGAFAATLKTAGNQTITAADTVTSSITGASATIAVNAGAVTRLSISAPSTAASGTAFGFTVTALDASNNRLTSYAGTVHFTSTDAAASLPANSTLTNGAGTFSATLKTAGSQTITASDTATPSIAGTSGAIALPTPPPPTSSTVTLGGSPNPSTLGQAVTFTASIGTSGGLPTSPGPTGTVQFFDGGKLLGSAGVSGGQATFTTTSLPGGNRAISAQYSGDSTWPAAQANLTQTVNATVTMNLTTSPAAPVFGQTVTLTANVNATVPTGFAAPTGQVTFQLASSVLAGQNTTLGVAALSSGVASFSLSTLPAGTNSIVAVYSGDATWTSRSVTSSLTVVPAAANVSVSLALVSGQLVLSSTASAAAPGAGTPTGSVQFVDTLLNTTVASATLTSGKASATLAESAAPSVLGRPIEAEYSGDANFQTATSAALPVVTNAAANLTASFAPDEIASIFGVTGLSGDTSATLPLTTSLAGAAVNVTDSAGSARPALLYGVFASTGQINFLVPSGTAAGLATVTVTLPSGGTLSTVVNIANTAPAVFTANMSGQGPYSGQIVVGHADGTQSVMSSAVLSSGNVFAPNPISLGGPGNQVYLVLYGTGIRHAASLTAAVNGVSIPVTYIGPQGTYAGLDQINLGPLPASLAGAGLINLIVAADGQAANTVTLIIE